MQNVNQSNPLFGPNRLKLATFCANNMPFLTHVRDGYRVNWPECLNVATMADQAGFDALVPIARWKGYLEGRPDHPSHEVFDPFIYAAAVAQATKRSAVFATTHVPTVHPVFIAKQAATIDAISGGRFALNVVGGWNRREFEMFGIDLLSRSERYTYLAEWLNVIRRLWTADEEFDFDGDYLNLRAAISRPRPVQSPHIPIMNAGHSAEGRAFAAQYADIALINIMGESDDAIRRQVEEYKQYALVNFNRHIQVWTSATIVQRDNKAEAEDFFRYFSVDQLDEEALDSFMETLSAETSITKDSPGYAVMRRRVAEGSGYPLVGDGESIARELSRISDYGVDGVLISMIEPADSVHRIEADVIPRLERLGLREPVSSTSLARA